MNHKVLKVWVMTLVIFQLSNFTFVTFGGCYFRVYYSANCFKSISLKHKDIRGPICLNTIESRFFEPPRETEIGSKYQELKKSKVA